MLAEFKKFISRGNVVDLAVAVVVGAAFSGVVTSFTEDILGGVLAALGGEPDFSSAFVITIGEGEIRLGAFITAIINFLIVALAVFLVVKALNAAQDLRRKPDEDAAAEPTEVEVLQEILTELRSQDR